MFSLRRSWGVPTRRVAVTPPTKQSLPDTALMWNGLSSTPRDLTREEFLGAVDHQRVVDR
jgi:hypothetical protein